MVFDGGNNWNETWNWTNDKIRVAAQSWLWARVELMGWASEWNLVVVGSNPTHAKLQ